jgi:hypothetical protein
MVQCLLMTLALTPFLVADDRYACFISPLSVYCFSLNFLYFIRIRIALYCSSACLFFAISGCLVLLTETPLEIAVVGHRCNCKTFLDSPTCGLEPNQLRNVISVDVDVDVEAWSLPIMCTDSK